MSVIFIAYGGNTRRELYRCCRLGGDLIRVYPDGRTQAASAGDIAHLAYMKNNNR